uniref:Variant surface glycoprotein 1125.5051 n=1 Tax=Trypanosoma brucei TaxID=5691 RepID=A0A1J0RBM8_9TRYP|nr:variant surface glycoprotein 1125.5051 [Trypanosoma brucei]
MWSAIILTLWLLLLSRTSQQAGENVHAFQALRLNFSAATSSIDEDDYTGKDDDETVPDSVLYLYMSSLTSKDYANETNAVLGADKQSWAAIKTELKAKKDDNGTNRYPLAPDGPAKSAAKLTLEKIHNESTALKNNIQSIKSEIKAATKEARETLSTAAYGGKKLKEVPKEQFAGRSTTCSGNTAATKHGVSIGHDMICICSGGTDSSNICGNNVGTTTYDGAQSTPATIQGLFEALRNAYAKWSASTKTTAARITATLRAFEETLRQRTAVGGAHSMKLRNGNAADCNGAGSSATCVDYTTVLGGNKLDEINLVKQMQTATEQLQRASSRRAALESARAEMKQKKTAAWTAEGLLKLTIPVPPNPTTQPPHAAQATKEEDCNKDQSSDKCKDLCK